MAQIICYPQILHQQILVRAEYLTNLTIDFNKLLDHLNGRKPQVSIVILDACRDNPYAGRMRGESMRGLARLGKLRGSFVMYSADANEKALDSLPGEIDPPNSIYTRNLVPLLLHKGLTINQVAIRVRSAVLAMAERANHVQTPAYYDGLNGTLCLAGGCEVRSSGR